jgi:flavin-dependent dehydrogenase
MKQTKVLIVGAGPAGSTCGYLLKKAGVDCILIDHATFPRDKICGGGLTLKSQLLLKELMPDFHYDYNPVTRVKLDIDDEARCEFEIADPIRVVQRKVFDNALLQQYQSIGGQFMKASLHTIEEKDGQVIVTLKSGEQVACQYLVGADGSNSRVRRHLNPDTGFSILAMEQYVEKQDPHTISIGLSRTYSAGGYYYRFPTSDFDIAGYGDFNTTRETFRQVMQKKGIPEGKIRGAYINMSIDYPLNDHILLIGDAGGFANRSTSEGLFDAFFTAKNAAEAIITNRPFREVNDSVFQKMKHEEWMKSWFYTDRCFKVLKWMCKHPGIIKWIFDTKMRRETRLVKKS